MSSGAQQVKRKLCIVCTGQAIEDSEIVILDLESDLHDLSVDCEQDDDSDPVLTPIAKLDLDMLNIRTFCALGSKLYMFDDGYVGLDKRFSVVTSDELKSAYAYDFSSSSSTGGVVKLGKNNVCKISDMWGPKACTGAAAPTPDGNTIVVYSSRIQYDPCDKENRIKRIDFELFDVKLNKWDILPGLAEKVAEKYELLGESNYTFDIQAFNFITKSVILVLVSGCWFSFDLDEKPEGVWRLQKHNERIENVRFGKHGIYYGEEPCLLFGERMCMSPMAVLDFVDLRFFSLPDLSYENSSVSKSSAHIALLDDDSSGEYKFVRVYMGLNQQTKLPHIVVDVFIINMNTYKPNKCLEIRFVKSSEFVLGKRERLGIGGYGVFPIIAGIDMSSTHEALEIDKTSTNETSGIDKTSTHEVAGIMSSTHEVRRIDMSSTHEDPELKACSVFPWPVKGLGIFL